MKPFLPTQRTGSLAGPVLPFSLILFVLVSPVIFGQQKQEAFVIDSILGVGIGTSLEQAHEKLDRLSNRKVDDDEEREEEKREGGRKQAWAMKETDYTTIALKVDRDERVVWITGFVRPGKEIPFAKLGTLSSATVVTDARAIWNVTTPTGGYRVIAKGQNRRARVVSILSPTPPVE